jgi:hypothetical protein
VPTSDLLRLDSATMGLKGAYRIQAWGLRLAGEQVANCSAWSPVALQGGAYGPISQLKKTSLRAGKELGDTDGTELGCQPMSLGVGGAYGKGS